MIIQHDFRPRVAEQLDERPTRSSAGAQRCRQRFLHHFPEGFSDETYLAWERDYKRKAHDQWMQVLNPPEFKRLLRRGSFEEIAAHAVRIESRTNLLFSFEKMALRDAVKPRAGARQFATGLYDWLHGTGTMQQRFEDWRDAIAALPRRQTRVLTWPLMTVFAFIAQPRVHMFLKPVVTRIAAEEYGFDFAYQSAPAWETYADLLAFARVVRRDLRDLKPRDMIDVQSFLWVQGSDEYPD